VGVSNGLFTVTLDFGGGVFTGQARWLEIAVRTNGSGAFTALQPRQELMPAPYALYATNAGAAAYAAMAGSALTASNTPWSGLTGVPAGFADGVDNDTTYTAGAGLQLVDAVLSAQFAGSGAANTVARSDHDHSGVYAPASHQHDAADVASGTLVDARLSTNVALRDAHQTFSGSNSFSGVLRATNAANQLTGTFTGDGAGLTNLNAAHLTGTVAEARIDGALARTNQVWPLVLAQHGPGSGLDADLLDGQHANAFAAAAHSHDAADISSGTLSDARLSANVALRGSSVTFTGSVTALGDLLGSRLVVGTNHTMTGRWSTIAGGSNNANLSLCATLGGGQQNMIQADARHATIAGGYHNSIENAAHQSTVGGGSGNLIGSNAYYGTIGGGYGHKIGRDTAGCTIAGGWGNEIQVGAYKSVIAGGSGNTIQTNAYFGAIGGGDNHIIQEDAVAATITGGWFNRVCSNAACSSIGGGQGNTVLGGARFATVPGGFYNTAGGNYTLAAGRRATATNDGCFVWADSQDVEFYSTRADEFSVRAAGGLRVQSGLGVKLNAADQPLITRGWDLFTSGKNAGVGRWGLFMEPDTLALGMPASALGYKTIRMVKYNADSSYTSLLTVDQAGTVTAAAFSGAGSGLTNLNGAALTAGSVGTAALANNAVTTAKIADAAVTSAKILDGTIGTADFADGIVTSGKLASDPASLAKVSGGTMAVSGTNVGIGTTTPGFKLEVNGDLRASRLNIGSAHALSGAGATIAGGMENTNAAQWATLGGGRANHIETGAIGASLAGGQRNHIQSNAGSSTIGGGYLNRIGSSADYATIAGGTENTNYGFYAVISGGALNRIQSGANWAVIGGGSGNAVGSNSLASTIGGGQGNTISNNIDFGTIPGGYANAVGGDYSFAAGRQAKANHAGCFVWADSTGADFASSAANQFLIRAGGGVGIGTTSPAQKLHVAGRIRMDTWAADGNTAVYKNASGDIGVQASDARLKQNIARITNALDAVRRMTGVTFNWRGDPPGAKKAVGLLAQEVQPALPELTFECQGEDGQTYLGVHYEKVTAVLVNALQEEAAQVAAQQTEIAALKQRLATLERLLAEKKGGAQ